MPTRFRQAAAAVVAAAVAVLGVATVGLASASAQMGSAEAEAAHSAVTAVQAATGDVTVTVLRSQYAVSDSQVELIENGQPISDVELRTATDIGRPIEIVYVLDVDNRSMANAGLSTMAGGIQAAVADLPESTKVGLVTAGRSAELLSRPSLNRTRLTTSLQGAVAEQGSAIADGIALAAASFSESPDVVRSIIVVTTGPDTASTGTVGEAQAAVVQAGAQTLWVGIGSPGSGLQRIVEQSGGVAVEGATVDGFGLSIARATSVAADRLLLTYATTGQSGERAGVSLSVADAVMNFSYPVGLNTTSVLQLQPLAEEVIIEPGFFGQPIVMYVSVGMAFVAIALAIWVLGSMYGGGETSLDNLLARYSEGDDELEEEEVHDMLVQSALVRRAVDITESFAEQRGFLVRVEQLLERANVPIAAGEGLFFLAAVSLVGAAVTFLVSGSVFVSLAVALLVGIGGYATVVALARRRVAAFESQLPDALQLLAGTLKAGYSLPQGLDAVSTEVADPLGYELRRAITEAQLGREIEDALAGIAERLGSEDFAWVVMAIGIQREVGGNLAEVLLTVAETMLQRDRLKREVSALTAEGRVSAGILAMLPPGLGMVMYVMNPGYIGVLFDRTFGLVLIGLAVMSGIAGLIWMKKVITIDV